VTNLTLIMDEPEDDDTDGPKTLDDLQF